MNSLAQYRSDVAKELTWVVRSGDYTSLVFNYPQDYSMLGITHTLQVLDLETMLPVDVLDSIVAEGRVITVILSTNKLSQLLRSGKLNSAGRPQRYSYSISMVRNEKKTTILTGPFQVI